MVKNVMERVKYILERNEQSRDNDALLIGILYKLYYGVMPQDPWEDVVVRLGRGDLPTFEAVTRARRKIQEENKELRGERYKHRKTKLEPEVREEMR